MQQFWTDPESGVKMPPVKLNRAIERAYEGRLTQTELGHALGVSQAAVSRWKRGEAEPSLDEIKAIEDACGRPRGFILRAAGYCLAPDGVLDAIEIDATLSDEARTVLRQAYIALSGGG